MISVIFLWASITYKLYITMYILKVYQILSLLRVVFLFKAMIYRFLRQFCLIILNRITLSHPPELAAFCLRQNFVLFYLFLLYETCAVLTPMCYAPDVTRNRGCKYTIEYKFLIYYNIVYLHNYESDKIIPFRQRYYGFNVRRCPHVRIPSRAACVKGECTWVRTTGVALESRNSVAYRSIVCPISILC